MGTGGQADEGRDIATLASRLRDARRQAFVGRVSELELFRSAIRDEPPPLAVLFVHGPGGVGKTSLLARFEEEARDAGRDPVRVDGRAVEPSPAGFLATLADALGVDGPDAAVATLRDRPRPVVLVDTYEQLAGLDGWLRQTFIPELPADALVVIAGRSRPDADWRADTGWQDLLRVVALRDLQPDDARALLTARGVPQDRHDEILRFARGHPLALVLLADVLAQGPADAEFALGSAPDVIEHLLDRFVRDIPSPAHAEALAVAAHAGTATEGLLRDTVDDADPHELFDWLQGLSFVQPVGRGIAPHDLVREILDADRRWRDPDRYTEMHRRVGKHLRRRVDETSGLEQDRAMLETLQLYRFSPVGRDFFAWDEVRDTWLEPAGPDDHEAIVELVTEHEGAVSGGLARAWLEVQPAAFRVFRRAGVDEPVGFVCHLLLGDEPGPEHPADPVAARAWELVRGTTPLRRGEALLLLRFWIDRETYQDVATHHLVSTRASHDWLTTPGLAWSFVLLAEPDFWEPIFTLIDFHRPADGEVVVDGRRYGMFARDWRTSSRTEWLELIARRRLSAAGDADDLPPPRERLLVLSHPEFSEAVRDALRGYARAGGFDDNPLLRSRVVVEPAGGRSDDRTLRDLLDRAASELSRHPRDEKLLAALRLTYLDPAPTQEAAAERLGLPFSTFRRHLADGIEHVVEWLWQRELHGEPQVSPAPDETTDDGRNVSRSDP